MENKEPSESLLKLMKTAIDAAKRRVNAEHLVRHQLVILPKAEDFIVATQQLGIDGTKVDVNEMQNIFMDISLPKFWSDADTLYTRDAINNLDHAESGVVQIPSDIEMHPVIQLSEYDATRHTAPVITWQRGTMQRSVKPWNVRLLYTHRLGDTGMVFVELQTPTEHQETRRDNTQYQACIVGFCIVEEHLLELRDGHNH
jgi:hypothetical protein